MMRISIAGPRITLLTLAAAMPIVLAACGGSDVAEPPRSRPSASTSSTPTATATPSTTATPSPEPSTPTPTQTPTPTEPKNIKAADGTDLDACVDAVCTVEVRKGDVIYFSGDAAASAGFDGFAVVNIRAGTLDFELGIGGQGLGSGTFPVSSWSNLNGIAMNVLSADTKRAVVRIDDDPRPGATTIGIGPNGISVITP